MPAKSKAQQALFGMALAVRRGDMKRSEVNDEVLKIVDSDMTDKEIDDFASTPRKGLKDHVKEGMMSLKDFINESKELTPSDDPIKNAIINYLRGFKIVWKVDTVDSAINDVTGEKYVKDYLDNNDIKGADKIYWMKCWNDGTILSKSYPYTNAEIVSYKNNTDVKWFFVVRGKDVTVIMYKNHYYGIPSEKKELANFKISL